MTQPVRWLWLLGLAGCGDKGDDIDRPGPDSEVEITPTDPVTTDDLTADADAISPLGDWALSLRWMRDGEPTDHTEAVLSAAETTKGEIWTVEAVSTDVNGVGATATADAVEIGNTAPDGLVVQTLPAAPTAGAQVLRCVVDTPATDIDADPVIYTVTWTREGEAFTDLSTTTHTGDTVPADALIQGEHWVCTTTPGDGEDLGPPATAEATVEGGFSGFGDASIALSDADHWFTGAEHLDYVGRAVAGLGDLDGDGLGEIIFGAHRMERDGRNRGAAFIVRGADLRHEVSSVPDEAASWIIEGIYDFEFSAYAVASAGDIDGDGIPDVLVSSHNNDPVAFNSGTVGLYTAATLGEPGTLTTADATVTFIGESIRAYTGYALDTAGDVDGDGRPDVLIGAFGNLDRDPYTGKAYVVLATETDDVSEVLLSETGTMMWGEGRREYAGWSVSTAGDTDGDGLDDVLVSAPGVEGAGTEYGKVYLVLADTLNATDTLELGDLDTTWMAESDYAWGGYDVEGIGDVDGDGRPEIAMSALLQDSMGRYPGVVYIFRGDSIPDHALMSDAPLQIAPEGLDDQLGREIAGDGDVDGDGLSDLLVGAMTATHDTHPMAGAAYLWLGTSLQADGILDAADADARFHGEGTEDNLGLGVAIVGDLDGDTLDDIAIGAHEAGLGGDKVGALGIWFSP